MSNKRREGLLGQVARLREIEHRAAAFAASQALAEAARTRRLADRAAVLVAGYRDLAQVTNSQELVARRVAGERMNGIAAQTGVHADSAAAIAETNVVAERQARRKREAIAEARVRLLQTRGAVLVEAASGGGLARFLNNGASNHRGA